MSVTWIINSLKCYNTTEFFPNCPFLRENFNYLGNFAKMTVNFVDYTQIQRNFRNNT